MNMKETASLLGKVSAIDNRPITDDAVKAWHEVIGHLSWPVAQRATVYALQNSNVMRVDPKHVLAEVRRAITELNNELDEQSERIDGFWRKKPVNYQQMEDFYRELWKRKPWTFQVKSGVSQRGYPIYRNLYGDELDAEVRKSAVMCGMTVPEPVWPEDQEPF